MLVLVAPGQGAQAPGFLTPWLDVPGVHDRLRRWSEVTDLDLVHYGTAADAEEIRDTAVAQPLLVAAGLVAADVLFGHLADAASCVGAAAGHSIGEFTAAAVAGVLTPESALTLVGERGRAMAAATDAGRGAAPTGMTAVLGGEEGEVLAALERHGLTPANINGAGQIVAAGTADQLAAFAADPPPKARLRPLSVAGAFHTQHMTPAVDALRQVAAVTPVAEPEIGLLSNRDGAVVRKGTDMLARLVDQVSAPVRWDACMRTMGELGVSAIIELPPAGTLAGLARRALPGVEILALKTPDDLEAARVLVAAHATTVGDCDHEPEWRLLVAPLAGTFQADSIPIGTSVERDKAIGRVVARREEQPVAPPYDGTLVEWLVEDGDPVSAGQPLVRIQPQVVVA
ncbi:MAG: acyltransferase domain-containing protein [Streptosporangiales bacterium]|nr:acyltransferase domain-containing protein [Streptosporangiales bacterium]